MIFQLRRPSAAKARGERSCFYLDSTLVLSAVCLQHVFASLGRTVEGLQTEASVSYGASYLRSC